MPKISKVDPEHMTVNQAMSYLGITRRTLERYVKDGRLTKYETLAPRRVHFRKEDLDELREGHPVKWDGIRLPIMVKHFDQWAREQGYTPLSEFVEKPAMEPLPKDIAEKMGLKNGTPAIHRVLVQSVFVQEKMRRYRISDNYYNPILTSEKILERMRFDPQFDTMEEIKQTTGKIVVKHRTEVIARLANTKEQQILKIPRATPILQATGENIAEDGTVIFINRRCFVGDMSELTMEEDVSYWK